MSATLNAEMFSEYFSKLRRKFLRNFYDFRTADLSANFRDCLFQV